MQIPHRERLEDGRERLVVVPDSVDDLWHLEHVIEPGDVVAGETTRRLQRKDEKVRSTGGEREHMSVTIQVDDVEFHQFANRLRVGGEILSASREDQVGFHHTLNVEIHDEITIDKHLKSDQADRLDAAVAAAEEPDVAIVTIEEGLAVVYSVNQYGPEEQVSITAGTGKGEFARDRSELFAELTPVLERLSVETIVLAGPGFTKEDAHDYLAEEAPKVAERSRLVDTSSAGDRGVHEVLQRGVLEEVRTATRIGREADAVEELMRRIATEEPATYGIEEVARAAEFGAVEQLLILDERLRVERGGEGEWETDVNTVIERVEQQGGEVTVVAGGFDPGRQLSNLGGIAALLRYQLD